MKEIIKKQVENIETYDNPIVVNKVRGINQAKSYIGWIDGRINVFRNRNNLEMVNILMTCKEVFKKFHPPTKTTIDLPNWKGNDELTFIEKPDSFDIIQHRKLDQDHEAKPIKRNIHKDQINNVLKALYVSKKIKDKDYIITSEIARNWCLIAEIRVNKIGNELFPKGIFDKERFYGSRDLHTDLNLILRLLDKEMIIHYRAGRTQILKGGFEFQINLL